VTKPATIGIPRALVYYLYPALWETFFRELGLEVVLSEPMTRRHLEQAGLISESEHCLPVKLFDAHLAELAGKVDLIFVPRILSMLPGHIACPKMGALPDCARAMFPERVKILSVDVNEARTPLEKSMSELGAALNTKKTVVRRAIGIALEALRRARQPEEAPPRTADKLRFLMIGHPYNLHDAYLAEPVLNKLERLGVYAERVSFAGQEVAPDPIKWDVCSTIYNRLKSINPAEWDGVIHLSSFNCGCDSVASVFYVDVLRAKGIPCMTLVLDEHSGQAGVDTRLEAFTDSIREQHEHTVASH